MTLDHTNKMSKASEQDASKLSERESFILAVVRELMVPLSRGLEDHTPIIITDGSASIEFGENQHYRRILGSSVHRARDLRLDFVEVTDRVHTQGPTAGTPFCIRRIPSGVECVIQVIERGNKGFNIRALPDGHTVELDFDHSVYNLDSTTFPSSGNGNRYGNRDRDIVGLRIFVDGELVHDCEFASVAGVKYTVYDPEA